MIDSSSVRGGNNGKHVAAPSPASGLHVPRIWIQPHYAGFNGLRALAISLVFLIHYGNYLLPVRFIVNMWVGVDLFFVLSGFLITGILYDSLHDPRFFRNFYTRRALRIFPLYYGFFLLLFLTTPLFHTRYDPSILFYFFYVGNLAMPFFNMIHHNPTTISMMLHHFGLNLNIGSFWTLCVEEQFYLLWPAVVWLVRSRARLMNICIAGSLAILLIRFLILWHGHRLLGFFGWYTYTRADTLLVGAWLALWLRGRALSTHQLRRLAASLFFGAILAFTVANLVIRGAAYGWFAATVGYTFIALGAAGLILGSLDDSNPFSRFLRIRALYEFGAISYGFYFVHALYLYEFRDLYQRHTGLHRFPFLIPIFVFGLSLLLARLSFRYIESPFLKLKRKLAPQWTPNASGPELPHGEPQPASLYLSEPRPDAS